MTPKPHLVLAGGGASALHFYGALKTAEQQNRWQVAQTTEIWCCSSGALLALFIQLMRISQTTDAPIEWQALDAYFINHPWHQVFKWSTAQLFQAVPRCGMYDARLVQEIFKPWFARLDLPLTLTLRELHAQTQIDAHYMVARLPSRAPFAVSHRTHPDLSVLDVIYASACLPILYRPFRAPASDTPPTPLEWWIDGGLAGREANYPLKFYLEAGGDVIQALGFYNEAEIETDQADDLPDDANLISYLFVLMRQFVKELFYKKLEPVEGEERITIPGRSIHTLFEAAKSPELRREWIEQGAACSAVTAP